VKQGLGYEPQLDAVCECNFFDNRLQAINAPNITQVEPHRIIDITFRRCRAGVGFDRGEFFVSKVILKLRGVVVNVFIDTKAEGGRTSIALGIRLGWIGRFIHTTPTFYQQ
jgi:hypothetical protein